MPALVPTMLPCSFTNQLQMSTDVRNDTCVVPTMLPCSFTIQLQMSTDGLGLCKGAEASSALVLALPMPPFDRCCNSFGEPLLCSSQQTAHLPHAFLFVQTCANYSGDHQGDEPSQVLEGSGREDFLPEASSSASPFGDFALNGPRKSTHARFKAS